MSNKLPTHGLVTGFAVSSSATFADPEENSIPVMNPEEMAILRHLAAIAGEQRHRLVVVVAGTRAWCHDQAQRLLAAIQQNALWIGDEAPPGSPRLQGSAAQGLLGTEQDAVVFDAHSGLDVEAFGAVSGIVRAGGGFLLLAPPLDLWPSHADPENRRITVHPVDPRAIAGRFLARFVQRIRTAQRIVVIEEGGRPLSLPPMQPSPFETAESNASYRTPEQQQAIAALHGMMASADRRPLVLRSDRGRGKSAALGIAAAELIRTRPIRILVTAPRFHAAETLFSHAEQLLPQGRRTPEGFRCGDSLLRFMPPDLLVREEPIADLVFVDEAAAIPAPLLEQLLARYPRIVFATTVHGYEGTGRGFDVRFRRHLDLHAPGWRMVHLDTPVRWARGDPLEQFVCDALLLDAAPAPDQAVLDASPSKCIVRRLERDELAADETRLRALFGLLVLAHYRTSSLDLRHLLDGPNLRVYAMTMGEHLIGAALVAREGGFDADLAQASADGKRRPRGHLLPQSLAFHGGMDEAPLLLGNRIVRIAIHPAIQGRGLGTSLLHAIERESVVEGIDYIGSSFGATPDLLNFWLRAKYFPVRVGSTREAASGAHAVLVMHAISEKGQKLGTEATRRLRRDLPLLEADALRDLEPSITALLMDPPYAGEVTEEIDTRDWRLLAGFAWGYRDYESVVAPLFRLARTFVDLSPLAVKERALLVAKVIEAKPWSHVTSACGVAGRGDVLRHLRSATAKLLEHSGRIEALLERDRLAATMQAKHCVSSKP